MAGRSSAGHFHSNILRSLLDAGHNLERTRLLGRGRDRDASVSKGRPLRERVETEAINNVAIARILRLVIEIPFGLVVSTTTDASEIRTAEKARV